MDANDPQLTRGGANRAREKRRKGTIPKSRNPNSLPNSSLIYHSAGIVANSAALCYDWPLQVDSPDWRNPMSDEESRAGYFLGLLDPEQRTHLGQVRKGLEVPCNKPTEKQLEEASNVELGELE